MSVLQHFMPLIMFVCLLGAVLIGIPIGFAASVVALIFAYILLGPNSLFILLTATTKTMNNWVLLAVPLFTFMSLVLSETDVIEDLYECFYKWSGSIRGGLAIATILVGAVMGAMTGVAAGTVTALGTLALPQMLKRKYNRNIAMGSVLAGGTLGQLIPPSVAMVIYGSITGVSVGGLFAGGITCGLLLAVIYCIYILIMSFFNKDLCPALPPEDRVTLREKFIMLKSIVLPLLLIIGVLGSIFFGIATPTEASAIGCVGAILCALVKRRLRWSPIKKAAIGTLRITTMVAWITIGAVFFGYVFTGLGGAKLITEIAAIIPFGKWGVLILTMVVLFFLGMFLDNTAIIMICGPIFSPLVVKLGFDPLWFGLLFMINMQIAYLSPPFGYCLFYLKSVTPRDVSIGDIYRSALPFIGLQLLGLLLVIIFPEIALCLSKVFVVK